VQNVEGSSQFIQYFTNDFERSLFLKEKQISTDMQQTPEIIIWSTIFIICSTEQAKNFLEQNSLKSSSMKTGSRGKLPKSYRFLNRTTTNFSRLTVHWRYVLIAAYTIMNTHCLAVVPVRPVNNDWHYYVFFKKLPNPCKILMFSLRRYFIVG
jgi:hypothetical protein